MIQCALPKLNSNHTLILSETVRIGGGHAQFRFEELWFLSNDFMSVVESEWGKNVFDDSQSRKLAV